MNVIARTLAVLLAVSIVLSCASSPTRHDSVNRTSRAVGNTVESAETARGNQITDAQWQSSSSLPDSVKVPDAVPSEVADAVMNGSVDHISAAVPADFDYARVHDNPPLFTDRSLLELAVMTNHRSAVTRFLLAQGADPRRANSYGQTPLSLAARNNPNPAVSLALIESGADPNRRILDASLTNFSLANHNPNPQVITALLEVGADPTIKDRGGVPVGYMFLHRSPAVLRALREHGVGFDEIVSSGEFGLNGMWLTTFSHDLINPAARGGVTALMIAAGQRQTTRETVEWLVAYGQDAAAVDDRGWNALHYAALSKGSPAVVVALVENGADPGRNGSSGRTPLMHASGIDPIGEMTESLLQHGADPDARTRDGLAALHFAVLNEDSTLPLRLLLQATDYVDPIYDEGASPLSLAAVYNKLEAVKTLLAAGAAPNLKSEYPPIVGAIENTGPSSAESGQDNRIEIAVALFDSGADPNRHTGYSNLTPLGYALRTRNSTIIPVLLERGADPNAQVGPDLRLTPLPLAAVTARRGSTIRTLIEAGADRSFVDGDGSNPLHYAAQNPLSAEPMRVLLEYYKDPDLRNYAGMTPLMMSMRQIQAFASDGEPTNSPVGVKEVLLKNGADPNLQDIFLEQTALHFAVRNPTPQIDAIALLLQNRADASIIDAMGNSVVDLAEQNEQLVGTDIYWEIKDQAQR